MLIYIILLTLTFYFLYHHLYSKRKSFPPGPTPLPFVGNTFQLNFNEMHKDIIKWKKLYGNILTQWMLDPYIIVNDYEVKLEKT